jgi:60 kDa SS-A/Ro ribonucleoprotein
MPGEKGERQVLNNAGGYVFTVSNWQQLRRFLILGTSGGTYYVSQRTLDWDNIHNIRACLREDYKRAIDDIVQVSNEGLAPKNDPAIFALAVACAAKESSNPNDENWGALQCRKYARQQIQKVCRIPTHLFSFVEYYTQAGGGWNRGIRDALSAWYNRPIDKVAYQLVKYQQREGWSNRDVLRLGHISPSTPQHNALFRWAIGADLGQREVKGHKTTGMVDRNYPAAESIPELVEVYERVKSLNLANRSNRTSLADEIGKYKLTHEMLPTEAKKYPEVWEALIPSMPLTALIRNLGNISKAGLLDLGSPNVAAISSKITDQNYLKRSRIHPLSILLALRTYAQGHGMRGSGEWMVNSDIVDALDKSFYASFGLLEPTGKRILHAVDISGSMHHCFTANNLITTHEAAATLMMASLHQESAYVTAFHTQCKQLDIRDNMPLDVVVEKITRAGSGGTAISAPIIYALGNKAKIVPDTPRYSLFHSAPLAEQRRGSPLEVDAIIIYTDSETWADYTGHPQQYFDQYKREVNPDAKAVVVAMTATKMAALDTKDDNVLQVAGFDASLPQVVKGFLTN